MLSLDCSNGGQMFRSALGLSVFSHTPFEAQKIRASRPKPGLKPQHLASLKTCANVCAALVSNARLESQLVSFSPGTLKDANLQVNVGTAGSISLLLQSLLLPGLKASLKLRVQGGTDVPFSPSFRFVDKVLFPKLNESGAHFSLSLQRRGYFPKGLGMEVFESRPCKSLFPFSISDLGSLQKVELYSHCASLPKEIVSNQLKSCAKLLEKELHCDIFPFEENKPSPSLGSGVDAFAFFSSGSILSATALGERGKSALKVGEECARALLEQISFGAPCDVHLADQLIPFMAVADGFSSIECKISQHLLDNVKVCESFLPVKFEVKGLLDEKGEVSVTGSAFKL
ncbi:MAG: RNA 3'-terminal phosphate cyclase [Candidatus Diapherotrites archaeon]